MVGRGHENIGVVVLYGEDGADVGGHGDELLALVGEVVATQVLAVAGPESALRADGDEPLVGIRHAKLFQIGRHVGNDVVAVGIVDQQPVGVGEQPQAPRLVFVYFVYLFVECLVAHVAEGEVALQLCQGGESVGCAHPCHAVGSPADAGHGVPMCVNVLEVKRSFQTDGRSQG